MLSPTNNPMSLTMANGGITDTLNGGVKFAVNYMTILKQIFGRVKALSWLQDGSWTKMPTLHLYTYGLYLTPRAKLVYMVIVSLNFDFNGVKERNQVSYRTLATITGYSVGTVKLAVDELIRFGWIQIEESHHNAHFYYTYHIFPQDDKGNITLSPTKEEAYIFKKGVEPSEKKMTLEELQARYDEVPF